MSAGADTCPICAKPREAKFAPFCSRRCAQIDLLRWLKGSYVIPGAEADKGGKPAGDDEETPEN
jgi:endogenous inhibitor of DNA gyrase (YacG/DUF329 family)